RTSMPPTAPASRRPPPVPSRSTPRPPATSCSPTPRPPGDRSTCARPSSEPSRPRRPSRARPCAAPSRRVARREYRSGWTRSPRAPPASPPPSSIGGASSWPGSWSGGRASASPPTRSVWAPWWWSARASCRASWASEQSQPPDPVRRVIAKASRAAGLLAGVAVLVLAVLISFDVLMRYFLDRPQLFVDEIGPFLLLLVL